MKNFLTALCAFGAAFFTATSFALTSLEDFEGYTEVPVALNIAGDTAVWASDEATDGSMGDAAIVTAYETGDKKPSTTTAGGNNYLKLETSAPLERYVETSGTATDIGNGLYFDGQVRFTACDEEPTIDLSESNPEKLIVYLRSNENTDEEGNSQSTATTNFVVVAGYYDEGNSFKEKKSYSCAVPSNYDYDPAAWHRLTIKTYLKNNTIAYFKILVDGTALSCSDAKGDEGNDSYMYDLAADEFPSLDATKAAGTLTSIGFKGTGAIDEIAWLASDPLPTMVKKAYVWSSGTLSLTVNGESKAVVSGETYEFEETDTIVVNFTPAEGYSFDETTDVTESTKDDVTTYTYAPQQAGAVVTINGTATYVKDFAAAVTLVNEQESEATVKLLVNASASEEEEGYGVAFDVDTILLLNGKTLTITGIGFYGAESGKLTIADYNESTVSSDGIIVAEAIVSDNLTIYGGKFSVQPGTSEGSNTYTTPSNYTLKQVDNYWQLVADGGSTEPTVDGDTTATIDNENKTITIDNATSAEIKVDGASEYTITVPAKVTKITGSVKGIVIKASDVDITSAFSVTTGEGVTTIALNPNGKVTVNGVEISVTPELADATDDVTPFAVASGSVSATVKAIPGLTYQLLGSTKVQAASAFDTTNPVAEETAGTDGTVTLKDEEATDTAKFYTIRVTR